MEKLRITLYQPQQAHAAWSSAWLMVKAALMAGHRLVLKVEPATRSLGQNAKFHAICDDIAKANAQWGGKPRTAEDWKVLFVSGHSSITKQGTEVLLGLEGELVNLRESTAQMSRARSSSLIEYTLAFCAMHGVRLSAPEYEGEHA